MTMEATTQKLDDTVGLWSGRFALLLAGWFLSSAWYGTLHLKHVETVDLPKAQAAAKCEHHNAQVAVTVAKKAIKSALVESAPVPSQAEIPKDNCPPVPVVK